MNGDLKILRKTVGHALSGKGAHVDTETTFAGLDWKIAGTRPEGHEQLRQFLGGQQTFPPTPGNGIYPESRPQFASPAAGYLTGVTLALVPHLFQNFDEAIHFIQLEGGT